MCGNSCRSDTGVKFKKGDAGVRVRVVNEQNQLLARHRPTLKTKENRLLRAQACSERARSVLLNTTRFVQKRWQSRGTAT